MKKLKDLCSSCLTSSVLNKIYILTALAIFFSDQLVKRTILKTFAVGQNMQVIGSWLSLTRVNNHGCSFGLHFGDGTTEFLVAFSLFVVFFFVNLRMKLPENAWLQKFAIALILGGTLGNLLDRLMYKSVVDYIQTKAFGIAWPVFNISDITIVVGVIIYCGICFFSKDMQGEAF
jgi:signal peptidase II